jgi:hypothetical protein
MARGSRLVRAMLVTFALAATLEGIVLETAASAPASSALPGTAMPLQEFVNDGFAGRAWNAYDQTASSDGPAIDGRPSPIAYGPTVHIYGRAANGDLTEFINDGFGGRLWNSYNLTQITGGPTIAADPDATFYGPIVHVYGEASNGDLIEYVNDGAGGRLWNAYDLTQAASGPELGGDPTPIVNGSVDRIFARTSDGDLVEYINDGANGQLWNAYDLTTLSSSASIAGDPNPVLVGTTVHVFAVATSGDLVDFAGSGQSWAAADLTSVSSGNPVAGRPSPVVEGGSIEVFARGMNGVLDEYTESTSGGGWAFHALAGPQVTGDPSAISIGTTVDVFSQVTGGDLTEFTNPGSGSAFTTTNLSTLAGGPAIGGDPGALLYGKTSVHVYAGGPPPAEPPAGVGLYGLAPAGQAATQAIEDNWPIIGDTGGLGTTSSPYTGMNEGADLATGQAIAASGKKVTWLSFWTISGPVDANPDGSTCFTSACYYAASYAAGQLVAKTIDTYASSGLSLKPNWVILDPEGFPDNHSGLDTGPGATDANWSSFIGGWANGLTSIDPGLHPGFYADQYEYNTFDLSVLQVPAFLAVAFPSPVNVLSDPSTNIAGFIAFGASCPAGPEEQTLANPPWGGSYNTLQFAGTYCGP